MDRKAILEWKEWSDNVWDRIASSAAFPIWIIVVIKCILAFKNVHFIRTSRIAKTCDMIFRISFGACFVYYPLDSIFIVMLADPSRFCPYVFLIHHVFGTYGLAFVFSFSKPIFWFELLPIAFHCTMHLFSDHPITQYFYLASLVFVIGGAYFYLPPGFPELIYSRFAYTVVIFSVVVIYYFKCINYYGEPLNSEHSALFCN